jgi:uncharacterized membrane protein YoaK (UPF0700 family)
VAAISAAAKAAASAPDILLLASILCRLAAQSALHRLLHASPDSTCAWLLSFTQGGACSDQRD